MRQIYSWHSGTKVALIALFAASALLIGVAGLHRATASSTQDCKWNSIIRCGEPTADAFIAQVRANNDKQGHHDLQAVYSDFGLVPSDYSKFVAYARPGVAKQDGTVVVDGQVVATDAWSIGRQHFSYATPMTISGHTYYKASDKRVLLENLPVMVLFNNKGEMQFAVMNACGNPVKARNIVPRFSCDLLQRSPVEDRLNTFTFSTNATATNNAKLLKVVYTFGDGTSDTETDLSTEVEHTYQVGACAGGNTCTAQATVYVSVPGSQTVTVTSAECQSTFNLTVPPTPKPPAQPTVVTAVASTPPPSLPSTGATGVIGLFTVVSVGSALGYRFVLNRRLKRDN